MADRTRDIVSLRKAAGLCRTRAGTIEANRATDYLQLAESIDQMIRSLTAATAAERAQRCVH